MKLLLTLLFLISHIFPQSKTEIPAIFGNNMVLQQNTEVTFWGKSKSNSNIEISSSWGNSTKTTSDELGNWKTKLQTPNFGENFTINLQFSDTTITYQNVLVGEVWICSGQSNMEMPLTGWLPADSIEGSKNAIENSFNRNIRYFTVEHQVSETPAFNCTGNWVEQNPETAASFSATAFFFAQNIYNKTNIPLGLIHSSWGGTPIETWTSAEKLATTEKYANVLNDIKNNKEEFENINSWLNTRNKQKVYERKINERWKNLNFNDQNCSKTNFDDSKWKYMNLPTGWEFSEVGNFDGVIWFRKKIIIPSEWKNKELILELGPIDDMDITFVNGMKIGSYEQDGFWNIARTYEIPANLVNDTSLLIAVRVIDNQGGGGIYGTSNLLNIHPKFSPETISIAGEWKYLPVAVFLNNIFYSFDVETEEFFHIPKLPEQLNQNTPTTLFNGMISPIIPFTIKGAIWYQGESNTGEPELYATLLPLMISDWREKWQIEFPFYFAQIAPWNYGTEIFSQILRESQLKSLKTPKTGMAVTMDVANSENVHPAKKREVGERLSLWALKNEYGKDIIPSGPIYDSFIIDKEKIILSFLYDEGMFLKPIDGKSNFQIAGEDRIFVDAQVEIINYKLIISSNEVKYPKSVRYCWDNTSYGTLFNNAKLPASSFRTDNWKN